MRYPLINFRSLDEDTLFLATRPVRNSLHENGTIEKGEHVFFRRNEDGVSFTLTAETGEPTNGNQYRVFADWKSVRAFVESTSLIAVQSSRPVYGLRNEYGFVSAYRVKELLGLRATQPLPDEGMPSRLIQGIEVWVDPIAPLAPQPGGRRARRFRLRVMARCPGCGHVVSVSRLPQHSCAPVRPRVPSHTGNRPHPDDDTRCDGINCPVCRPSTIINEESRNDAR